MRCGTGGHDFFLLRESVKSSTIPTIALLKIKINSTNLAAAASYYHYYQNSGSTTSPKKLLWPYDHNKKNSLDNCLFARQSRR